MTELPSLSDRLARQLSLRRDRVAAALALFDAGNTLPFIARYRKEVTGGLDEEQLRRIADHAVKLRALDERRAAVLAEIEAQGKLTPGLQEQVLEAPNRTALEDLYLPFRPKRKTRATAARQKGLQGLADLIVQQSRTAASAAEAAQPFLSEAAPTAEDALAGARDIVAELISDHPEVRRGVRERALKFASLTAEKIPEAQDARGVYRAYSDFSQRVDRLRPHQVLALNRGEREKVLRLQMALAERDWLDAVTFYFRPDRRSPLEEHLTLATNDAAQRLLLPAIERDVRRHLNEQAEAHAIAVFATNLRGLLTQPPLPGKTVLGLDPGFRTGCKVVVVDPTGKVLETATIFPHAPQRKRAPALEKLSDLVARHGVSLIAIGNGTASHETEELVAELTRGRADLNYLVANEAGASVYSASPLARAELPDLDVSLRGAVSIARRVQDPLAELVKIDPRSIGVGLYQHDVDQGQLAQALDGVVESVVNQVGVDVNTASGALLTYVAGVGPRLAERLVNYRDEHGPFRTREVLRAVPGLGARTFEQAAGFLRIHGLDEPLDESAIHPESYAAARAVLARAGLTPATPPSEREPALAALKTPPAQAALAAELGIGAPTLADILEQLVRPGRDPRQDLPAPVVRSDVLSLSDLQVGMRLQGTVRNVVDFGAFVDVGLKQDGLLHRSQVPRGQSVHVGDVVDVSILAVDTDRSRISLGWGEN